MSENIIIAIITGITSILAALIGAFATILAVKRIKAKYIVGFWASLAAILGLLLGLFLATLLYQKRLETITALLVQTPTVVPSPTETLVPTKIPLPTETPVPTQVPTLAPVIDPTAPPIRVPAAGNSDGSQGATSGDVPPRVPQGGFPYPLPPAGGDAIPLPNTAAGDAVESTSGNGFISFRVLTHPLARIFIRYIPIAVGVGIVIGLIVVVGSRKRNS